MDKYTVDLDKVLNDFEYNELTEQSNGYSTNNSISQPVYNYTTTNSLRNQFTHTTNPRSSYTYDGILPNEQYTYPKVPIPTTKHSINNVFHSLNEYLNSDIKTTDFVNASSSFADTNVEIEPCPPVLIRKSSNDTTIQDIFKNLTKENNSEIFKNFTSDSNKQSEPVEEDDSYKEIKATEIQEEMKTDNADKKPSFCSNENIISSDETETTCAVHLTHPEENISKNTPEAVVINSEETVLNSSTRETCEELNNVPVKVIGFEDITDISDSEMNKELELLEAEYEKHFSNEENESDVKKDLRSELEEVNLSSSKLISFNSLETDEQLLDNTTPPQELEDEEVQHNEKSGDTVKLAPGNETEGDVPEDEILEDKSVIEEGEEPTCQQLDSIENEENDEEIEGMNTNEACEVTEENVARNACAEVEASVEKDDEIYEKTAPGISVTVDNDQIVNSKSTCVNNEAVNQGTIIDISCEEKVDCLEIKKTEEQDTVTEKADACSEGKIERKHSGLMRPNSLDLNSDTGSDNVTIDLIGEPGSTPYNNVYVQNKLQTDHKIQKTDSLEAEGEPNNSLSPTLSDASTIDNSDSPNTSDSCNDTSLDEYCGSARGKPALVAKNKETPNNDDTSNSVEANADSKDDSNSTGNKTTQQLGQIAPFWIPDSETQACQHCQQKFTVLRRRHHCRACGLVLCAACCHHKYPIPYMGGAEARVCARCLRVLQQLAITDDGDDLKNRSTITGGGSSGSANSSPESAAPAAPAQPASVLKRTGSAKSRHTKSVTFCDGVRPGHDVSETVTTSNTTSSAATTTTVAANRSPRSLPDTQSYIPAAPGDLPPIVTSSQPPAGIEDRANNNGANSSSSQSDSTAMTISMLHESEVKFALRRNLYVRVRIINMDCCINKTAWCFTTEGMITVGQDEIILLLEFIDNEREIPKDIFYHLDNIYNDALKGTSIAEMGLSIHSTSNFLGSKNHVGFLYVKPTFQCTQNLIIPKEPYLIGILIHRWETPWAKIFPLRLLLRLGAEHRYYPSPIISTRHRESVYVEIGHTIVNLLADFRNFSYTIPAVRGLTIHMEGKNTTVSIPSNRYDQVMKALNNSSDHILAFAANFSPKADSHLVCIQDTHGNNENSYTTHAINIHNRPRKVTGASFIVLNGALKSSSGLTAKSSIVEDGLMIQILPDQMVKLRNSLRNMKDFKINCGCLNAQSDEYVNILWTENDVNFNVGVTSPIDATSFSGVPSIRVHNSKDYVCNSGNKLIRWTEVFIIQSGEECSRSQDPIDISKLSESIAKATAHALVKYLDLLAANNFMKIGIRTTLHVDNVSYLAGSNGTRLPPIYMKSLDNELVPVLHRIITSGSSSISESAVILELVFHILNA